MHPIFLQTYSYGRFDMPRREMLQKAAEMGYEGVEVMGPLDEAAAAELAEFGLGILDAAVELGADGSIANADLIARLGIKFAGTDTMIMFGDHEQALQAAEAAEAIGAKLARYGLKLYYHNHTHEFRSEKGEYLLETFIENTDPAHVTLQLDCGWATCAGADPIAFMAKHAGRVGMIHIKACTSVLGTEAVAFIAPPPGPLTFGPMERPRDMDPAAMEAIMAKMKYAQSANGAMRGDLVPWRKVIDAAAAQGCQGYIIERERAYDDKDRIQCLTEDLTYIREVMQ
jgi:sugar phosphate isomerase/epimerase